MEIECWQTGNLRLTLSICGDIQTNRDDSHYVACFYMKHLTAT